jgi:mono/diheme cytochrome c family protein
MTKHLLALLAVVAASILVPASASAQGGRREIGGAGSQGDLSIPRTSAANGQEMFRAYCTPCHGPSGRGDGPVGKALKTVPADLTRISARNGGSFPDVKVRRFIEGLDEIPSHGTREMPLWGPTFRAQEDGLGELRVANLANYLKSIQRP